MSRYDDEESTIPSEWTEEGENNNDDWAMEEKENDLAGKHLKSSEVQQVDEGTKAINTEDESPKTKENAPITEDEQPTKKRKEGVGIEKSDDVCLEDRMVDHSKLGMGLDNRPELLIGLNQSIKGRNKEHQTGPTEIKKARNVELKEKGPIQIKNKEGMCSPDQKEKIDEQRSQNSESMEMQIQDTGGTRQLLGKIHGWRTVWRCCGLKVFCEGRVHRDMTGSTWDAGENGIEHRRFSFAGAMRGLSE
ncbi:hypothetical protein L6452_13518 [Arctium lappa]|uniref:Uncharacterized protein n=1 Tax=Arctium lappa TaxID=4217 RepID=A0ACB9CID4_ARCLA|nr:hypothetical protein L6452_13518 [Arctium lappa]